MQAFSVSLSSSDTPSPGAALAAACFDAGAALALLGQAVTTAPRHQGVWRDRLVLRAAAACLAMAGRHESDADIRDAVLLTRPGADPGPIGHAFAEWRGLVSRTPRLTSVADLRAILGARRSGEALDRALVLDGRPAPLAAAAAAATLHRDHPRDPALAMMVADLVLARSLGWPRLVPLLAAGLGRRPPKPDAADWPIVCTAAYGRSAGQARLLSADLAQRADRLLSVQARLRAKTAAPVISALLSEDALSATVISDRIAPAMSDRAARRLLERLVGLDAVRELTGRATHRLYGL